MLLIMRSIWAMDSHMASQGGYAILADREFALDTEPGMALVNACPMGAIHGDVCFGA